MSLEGIGLLLGDANLFSLEADSSLSKLFLLIRLISSNLTLFSTSYSLLISVRASSNDLL